MWVSRWWPASCTNREVYNQAWLPFPCPMHFQVSRGFESCASGRRRLPPWCWGFESPLVEPRGVHSSPILENLHKISLLQPFTRQRHQLESSFTGCGDLEGELLALENQWRKPGKMINKSLVGSPHVSLQDGKCQSEHNYLYSCPVNDGEKLVDIKWSSFDIPTNRIESASQFL